LNESFNNHGDFIDDTHAGSRSATAAKNSWTY